MESAFIQQLPANSLQRVPSETAICEAQTRLAKVCLGKTADQKPGPWREMITLGHLPELRVKWHDWQAFLDWLISEMEAWDNLGWNAFQTLFESVSPDLSLYRELIERISERMRIAEVVEDEFDLATNVSNRLALIELIGPMSRRQKRNVIDQNIGFLVGEINYDDAGINIRCLELFLELSTVPLLSSEQRTGLLTHKDDYAREIAEELFERVPETEVE